MSRAGAGPLPRAAHVGRVLRRLTDEFGVTRTEKAVEVARTPRLVVVRYDLLTRATSTRPLSVAVRFEPGQAIYRDSVLWVALRLGLDPAAFGYGEPEPPGPTSG